jgi:serine/threonine-protein kinase
VSSAPVDIEAHLATLGVGSLDLALDATITPETFARTRETPSSSPSASVGPLPRIALSGAAAHDAREGMAEGTADLEILGLLGEGGMGRVHLARQRSLGRDVAIKMLKDELADPQAMEMLRVEATIMGRLEHPNVVPVHAVGLDGAGRLLLVMKRIDGAPWLELLRDTDHPRWAVLAPRKEDRLDAHLSVLTQVANALELAHQRGVIHRDVKPENVLLGPHGEVYLADWGVALRTDDATGQDLVGTPSYMAPEMVEGVRARIDARTDVYLLGATLHEVLTGSPPHHGATVHATLLAAFDGEPKTYDGSVPPELAAIARRAMSKRPNDRYASALEFRRALDEVRTHRGSIAMTRSALPLLAELEGSPDAETDRKLTECRFALSSALREWPNNEEAKRALERCLRLAIRHELARENVDAARAIYRELGVADAAIDAAIDDAQAKVNARAGELARLRSMEADRDLSVGLGPRIVMLGTLVTVGVGLTVFVAANGGTVGTYGPWDVVRFGALVFGSVLAVSIVFARRLLANAIGRGLTALILLSTGGLVAHRIIAAEYDVPPAATLTMDLVILAVSAGAAGTLLPRTAWAALPALLGIVVTFAFPDRVPMVFSLTTLAMMATIIVTGAAELRARGLLGASKNQ